MTIKELTAHYGLATVKRGKYSAVLRNKQTGTYELWQITKSGCVIEQIDEGFTKTEALGALEWEENNYERLFNEWLYDRID